MPSPDKTVLFTASESSGTVIATDLQSALARQTTIAKTGTAPDRQFPAMGCSIKWKAA